MAVALRYHATGESQASLSYNYRIGRSTVCDIMNEVPEKIREALSPIAATVPTSCEVWKRLANLNIFEGVLLQFALWHCSIF